MYQRSSHVSHLNIKKLTYVINNHREREREKAKKKKKVLRETKYTPPLNIFNISKAGRSIRQTRQLPKVSDFLEPLIFWPCLVDVIIAEAKVSVL